MPSEAVRESWPRSCSSGVGQEPRGEGKNGRSRKELGLVEIHGLLRGRRKGKNKGIHISLSLRLRDVRGPESWEASSWVSAGLTASLLHCLPLGVETVCLSVPRLLSLVVFQQ